MGRGGRRFGSGAPIRTYSLPTLWSTPQRSRGSLHGLTPARRSATRWCWQLPLFAVNGTVSKVVLSSGISSVELTQGAFDWRVRQFLAAALVLRPRSLRVSWRELAFLALFGVTGVAFVQWFYFVAIHRLPVGIALLIQYLALLVALFAFYVLHEPVRRRIWLALGLALTGLALVVQVWDGLSLDGVGVAASLGAAFAYATYILMAEHETARKGHRPRVAVVLRLLFAALFWAVVQPCSGFRSTAWTTPYPLLGNLAEREAPVWLLMLFVVVIGTITFALITSAARLRDARRHRGHARAGGRERRCVGLARRDVRRRPADRRRNRPDCDPPCPNSSLTSSTRPRDGIRPHASPGLVPCWPERVVTLTLFLMLADSGCGGGTALSSSRQALLRAVNDVRAANGLSSLSVDDALTRAARHHSRVLLERDRLGHGDVSGRLRRFGARGTTLGENLAWGAGRNCLGKGDRAAWMNSPPHRANLLSAGYRRIGLGAAVGRFAGWNGATVVTADFAGG